MNNGNLKPFEKGDSRINRAGRPKSFSTLQALAQQIGAEDVGGMTRVERILRAMADGEPQQQAKFLEFCYGRIPTAISEQEPVIPRLVINMCAADSHEEADERP